MLITLVYEVREGVQTSTQLLHGPPERLQYQPENPPGEVMINGTAEWPNTVRQGLFLLPSVEFILPVGHCSYARTTGNKIFDFCLRFVYCLSLSSAS